MVVWINRSDCTDSVTSGWMIGFALRICWQQLWSVSKCIKIAGELANTSTVKEKGSRNLAYCLNWFPSLRLTFRRNVFNGAIMKWFSDIFIFFVYFWYRTAIVKGLEWREFKFTFLSMAVLNRSAERKLCAILRN